jgi:hypothetical protein
LEFTSKDVPLLQSNIPPEIRSKKQGCLSIVEVGYMEAVVKQLSTSELHWWLLDQAWQTSERFEQDVDNTIHRRQAGTETDNDLDMLVRWWLDEPHNQDLRQFSAYFELEEDRDHWITYCNRFDLQNERIKEKLERALDLKD